MDIKLHEEPYVPYSKRISYLYIPGLFVLVTILMEVIMFAVMGFSFPSAYIFSLTIVLTIATIATMVRIKWVQTIICSVFLVWQTFTTISTIIAYQTCNEIFSLETFKTLTTAFGNADAVVLKLWFLFPIITLLVVYVVGLVLIMCFMNLPKKYRKLEKQSLFCGILAFVSFLSYTFAYSTLPNYQRGDFVDYLSNHKLMYDTFSNRLSNFQTFGSYSFYLDNLLALMGGKEDILSLMDIKTNPEFVANEFALSKAETLGKGYNLITVLMETFERQAVNPITMPNLHQFMQESCTEVNGYYSVERTCISDHISQTGMHVLGKEYWNNYGNVKLPNTLANIFKRSGYKAEAFHNSTGRCYDRNNLFEKSMGFDEFYNYYMYENPQYYGTYSFSSDELLFTENLTKIAPSNQNFYSYVISVATHSTSAKEYDLHEYHPEHFAFIEDPENWEKLTKLYPVLLSDDPIEVLTAKNYLAGARSFDFGFGALIDYLKNTDDEVHPGKKLIETTALVMFGDHYYYANPKGVLNNEPNYRDLLGNRCTFIVYNPRQIVDQNTGKTQADNALLAEPAECGITLNRFTSNMDIYPTICSLFGIKTDQQLTYGRSIFDTDPSIGVTYLTGYTFGATRPVENRSGVDNINGGPQIDWQIWKTLDFVNYNGVSLNAEQLQAITPTVNRVYNSIYVNSKLYDQDGFEDLSKTYYSLPNSNLI